LLAVADYGAERWGFEAAHAFLDSFENAFALLERHPDIGRYRDELGPNARSWLHRGYVILYTHTESAVTIDRILHAAADLPDSHYGRDSAETGQ
jgi:plasmid stabilization system protein ParE